MIILIALDDDYVSAAVYSIGYPLLHVVGGGFPFGIQRERGTVRWEQTAAEEQSLPQTHSFKFAVDFRFEHVANQIKSALLWETINNKNIFYLRNLIKQNGKNWWNKNPHKVFQWKKVVLHLTIL